MNCYQPPLVVLAMQDLQWVPTVLVVGKPVPVVHVPRVHASVGHISPNGLLQHLLKSHLYLRSNNMQLSKSLTSDPVGSDSDITLSAGKITRIHR
ncbi:hypothetical protein Tco_0323092 [Tanacetum coccineum]